MSHYTFFDEDIEKAELTEYFGGKDSFELHIRDAEKNIILHKDDIVHLAKRLGLVVYDADAAL